MGSGGQKSPSGVQGQSPGRGLEAKLPDAGDMLISSYDEGSALMTPLDTPLHLKSGSRGKTVTSDQNAVGT